MKRNFRRVISVCLAAVMVITIIPMIVYADNISESKVDRKTANNIPKQSGNVSDKIVAEITELRTENSKTYLMDDGTYCDVISAKQIHVRMADGFESVAPQLEQLPSAISEAVKLINEHSKNTENTIDYTPNSMQHVSQDNFDFFACNPCIDFSLSNGTCINLNVQKGIADDKSVFLMKPHINELYFSDNRVINNVCVGFDVSTYNNTHESRLYCYYGDNNHLNSNIEYKDLSEKRMIDYCNVKKETTQILFDITEIYSKWDRNSVANNGIYFGCNANVSYTLSNPTVTVAYTARGCDDANQTYHNIDLGNAGQVLINDYTNTLTLKQTLAGIDLNLMGVDLTKYLTFSNDGINSSCGPNSTLNYNSSVKLYNNSLVWKMFDGSQKVFNRPIDSMADENGVEHWAENKFTSVGDDTAELNIDAAAIENEGTYNDYSNVSIEYGNSVYTFDSNGYLSQIACGDTNIQISFSNGTITEIIDGSGNKYSLVYGSFQYNNEVYTYLKKISVKDKNNASIKYDGQNDYTVNCLYTANEDNTVTYKTVYPNNEALEVIYDNSFNIISLKYNGITTAFEYKEGQKNISGYTQTDKDNNIVSNVSIDSSNTFERIYTYITEDGKTEILDFNKLGQLISSIDKNGNQVCFGYDDYGNLCSYALEERTPNLIEDGDMDVCDPWSEIGNRVEISDSIAEINYSLSAEQGLWQNIGDLSADKTYVLSIAGHCKNMMSADDAFLGAVLSGYDENGNETSVVLPLIIGNSPESKFEVKRIAFKPEKNLSDVEIDIISYMQANGAVIDCVSLQEAEKSSVLTERVENRKNIETVLDMFYKPADYTEVEKAKSEIPEDLSIYTDESVADLQAVLDGVDYTLPLTEQATVDGYAEAITEAVNALEKKPVSPTSPEEPTKPDTTEPSASDATTNTNTPEVSTTSTDTQQVDIPNTSGTAPISCTVVLLTLLSACVYITGRKREKMKNNQN